MNKSKIFMMISVITFIITILGAAGTYAWYKWSTTDDQKTTIVTNVGAATVYYNAGADISASLIPVADKANGIVKTVEVKSTSADAITFGLYLDILLLEEGLKNESFRYQIYNGETLLSEGNFSQTFLDNNATTCETDSEIKHLTLFEGETISSTITTYTLYIWIDGTMSNPNAMQNSKYKFNLHAMGENAIIKEGIIPEINDIPVEQQSTFAYQILRDYYYAEKSEITNNDVKYYYDTEHSLMSDIGGNVRYYGKNPNNYIYFNCDSYASQTEETCELWRIIGVFDGKVKIIRNSALGIYSYDYDYNDGNGATTKSNDWSKSSLMTLLNGAYYNNENTTYYNGNTTGTAVNFNTDKTGIKNNETRNMISDHLLNLGGNSTLYGDIYSDQLYTSERGTTVSSGNAKTWRGKIAIMYASDYGYARDFRKYSSMLSANDNGYNWLFFKNNGTGVTLTHNSNSAALIWFISLINGNLSLTSSEYSSVSYSRYVFPTLYLVPNITSISGTGTSTDPYMLSL